MVSTAAAAVLAAALAGVAPVRAAPNERLAGECAPPGWGGIPFPRLPGGRGAPRTSVFVETSGAVAGWTPVATIARAWEGDALAKATDALRSDKGFKVDYYDTYKDVCNRETGERYVLVQCGTTAPELADLDPDFCVQEASGDVGDPTDDSDKTGDAFCAAFNSKRRRKGRNMRRKKRCRASSTCKLNYESKSCLRAQNKCAGKQIKRHCKRTPDCEWKDGTSPRKRRQGTCSQREPGPPPAVKFFSVPLKGYATDSSTPVAYFQELGLLNRAEALPELVVSPCAQAMLECGAGLEPTPPPTWMNKPEERVEAAKGFSSFFTDGADPGIPSAVAFSAFLSLNPLSRASWIKFAALFYNMEEEANAQYNAKVAQYERTKKETAAEADRIAKVPTVAWVQRSLAGFNNPEKFIFSFAAYKIALTADAGAKMLNPSRAEFIGAVETGTGATRALEFLIKPTPGQKDSSGELVKCDDPKCMSASDALQRVQSLLANVDVMVEESYRATPDFKPKVLTPADIRAFYGVGSSFTPPPVANKKVWTLDGIMASNGASGWFEGAFPMAARVLGAYARAIHGTGVSDAPLYWFRNVYDRSPVSIQGPRQCSITSSLCPAPKIDPIPFNSA